MDQIYELGFYDAADTPIPWHVKFFVPSYSGAVETLKGGDQPVLFEFQNSSDDMFDPWKPSQVRIQIVVTENFKFEDLFDPNEMYCWVEIYQGGDGSGSDSLLFWQGWVDPSQYEEPYDVAPYYLSITCVDGLNYLQNYEFADQQESENVAIYYEGREYEHTIILNILTKIGFTEFNEFINLYEQEMSSSSSDSPMNQLQEDRDVFYAMNCEEVLKHILKKYNASIRQCDGIFNIFRPIELKKTIIYGRYFLLGSNSSPISFTPTQYIHRFTTHPSSVLKQVPGGNATKVFPARKVNINFNYGSKESWLNNHILSRSTWDETSHSFESWINIGSSIAVPISNFVEGEEEGVLILDPKNTYFYQAFGADSIATDETETYVIEFDYGIYSKKVAVQDNVRVKFFLRQNDEGVFRYSKSINTDSSKLKWNSSVSAVRPPALDSIVYGWNGWHSYRAQIQGLPMSGGLEIFLQTEDWYLWAAFKNIRFRAYSSRVARLTKIRTLWERLDFAGGLGWGEADISFRSKYYLAKERVVSETVVANTYNPITNIEHGQVLDYDYILGDVIRESSPEKDGDVNIYNISPQFAGALSSVITETLALAIQNFVTNYYNSWLLEDVVLTCIVSGATRELYFEATVAGEDFSGSTSLTNLTGDVAGTASTVASPSAGTKEVIEITFSGTDGACYIQVGPWDGVLVLKTTLDAALNQFITDCQGEMSSVILANEGSNVMSITEVSADGGVAVSTTDIGIAGSVAITTPGVAGTKRKDKIILTGSTGTATVLCNGLSRTFSISTISSTPTEKWGTEDESSDIFPWKPLLELIGDEIAGQYSRPKQLIQMPIIERGDQVLGLDLLGNIIDEENTYGGVARIFTINRGSLDVRNRKWELDLLELISYTGPNPETESSAVESYTEESSSGEIIVTLNHIDTVSSKEKSTTSNITFNASSNGDITKTVYWHVRDSAHLVASDGSAPIHFTEDSSDSDNYSIAITYPSTEGTDFDIQISFSSSVFTVTSNHFNITGPS